MLRDYLEEQIRELERVGLVRDKEERKIDFLLRGLKSGNIDAQVIIDNIISKYMRKENYVFNSPEAKRVLDYLVNNLDKNNLDLEEFRVVNGEVFNGLEDYDLIRDKEKLEWFRKLHYLNKVKALDSMYRKEDNKEVIRELEYYGLNECKQVRDKVLEFTEDKDMLKRFIKKMTSSKALEMNELLYMDCNDTADEEVALYLLENFDKIKNLGEFHPKLIKKLGVVNLKQHLFKMFGVEEVNYGDYRYIRKMGVLIRAINELGGLDDDIVSKCPDKYIELITKQNPGHLSLIINLSEESIIRMYKYSNTARGKELERYLGEKGKALISL